MAPHPLPPDDHPADPTPRHRPEPAPRPEERGPDCAAPGPGPGATDPAARQSPEPVLPPEDRSADVAAPRTDPDLATLSRDADADLGLDALRADRALVGLDPARLADLTADELAALDDESLDRTAAALDLALAGTGADPLPESLRRTIEAEAPRHLGPPPTLPMPTSPGPIVGTAPSAPGPIRRAVPWLGWLAAAAAVLLWLGTRNPGLVAPPTVPPNPPEPSLVERLAGAAQAVLVASEHPLARGAGGRVVWDADRQQGYLRLEGLAPVDPRRGAYQLWIFDAERDQRYPVDGALFTLDDSSAPAVIPIRAPVPVRQPTLFAITLEPPGGVVVSDRKRILLTAAWPG